MARGYTSEQREAAKEAYAENIAPKVYIERKRLMMELKGIDGYTKINVDVTPLFHFLKEMFTTDWEKQS